MKPTVAAKILDHHLNWRFEGELPEGFRVLEPLDTRPETRKAMETFYHAFYADHRPRIMLIGINPSRHGAGVTGIPFTDTKQLAKCTGFQMSGPSTHELSSVFIYDVIDAYGGPHAFYRDFYIHSPFPQAIVRKNKRGNWVNATYYETSRLYQSLYPSMIKNMHDQLDFGLSRAVAVVLGRKNFSYLAKMNQENQWFEELKVLDHPRFIQQYQPRNRLGYIAEYLNTLASAQKKSLLSGKF